ncbi:MAG: hypothetical protein RLY71_3707 [Pseudomonadota bacterium]|jgi:hypothetical protein
MLWFDPAKKVFALHGVGKPGRAEMKQPMGVKRWEWR